jgi:hypothetical protein
VTGLRPDSDDDRDIPAPVLTSAERLGLLSSGPTALHERVERACPQSAGPGIRSLSIPGPAFQPAPLEDDVLSTDRHSAGPPGAYPLFAVSGSDFCGI